MAPNTVLESPPKRAGIATISFNPDADQNYLAGRRGNHVTIHRRFDAEGLEVHSLQGGQQLVIHETTNRAFQTSSTVFLGTDEAVFATAVVEAHYERLRNQGEAAFYEGLIPPLIRKLRRELGPEAIHRQGDFHWAILGKRRGDLSQYRHRLRPFMWIPVKNRPIGGTSHQLTGHMASAGVRLTVGSTRVLIRGPVRLVSGVLTAPDHANRQMGPSVLLRGEGLVAASTFVDEQGQVQRLGD